MRAIKLSKHFRPLLGIFCVVHTLQRRPKITKMSYHCECASCGVTLSQYPYIQPRANKCPNVFLVLSCKFSNNFWVTIPFSFHCVVTWRNSYLLFLFQIYERFPFPTSNKQWHKKCQKPDQPITNSHVFTLYKKFFWGVFQVVLSNVQFVYF